MSRRVQIILPDDEYQAVMDAARLLGKPVSRIVRESLRRTLTEDVEAQQRVASILRFAEFAGPTGDIERILDEIERGRGHPALTARQIR